MVQANVRITYLSHANHSTICICAKRVVNGRAPAKLPVTSASTSTPHPCTHPRSSGRERRQNRIAGSLAIRWSAPYQGDCCTVWSTSQRRRPRLTPVTQKPRAIQVLRKVSALVMTFSVVYRRRRTDWSLGLWSVSVVAESKFQFMQAADIFAWVRDIIGPFRNNKLGPLCGYHSRILTRYMSPSICSCKAQRSVSIYPALRDQIPQDGV